MLNEAITGGFEVFKKRFGTLFLAWLLYSILTFLPTFLVSRYETAAYGENALPVYSNLVSALVSSILLGGFLYVYLQASRGNPVHATEVLSFPLYFWKYLLAGTIYTLIISLGLLLLLIPGIFLAVRLGFWPYAIADGRGVLESLSYSWNLTKGHFWSLLGLYLLAVVIILIGVLLLVIGVIPATILVYAMTAQYYVLLQKARPSP
ncbi:MAG: glycerophosphoryl diester phosphodiesterase membrane domain-containing protein [Hydrogenibacillus sp.]|nr:glycerophosphoryl diester phosphodiesterase membrane domain-containing protein [Hydrogenibacillus sp.]